LRKLYRKTPLGVVGVVLLGTVHGSFLGLGPVFGAQLQLEPRWISAFMTTGLFVGLSLQYPIGWLSDRFDRRLTLMAVAAFCGAGCLLFFLLLAAAEQPSPALVLAGAAMAGTGIFPLYAVILAYTNDSLPQASLVTAAAALALAYSLGASLGPPLTSLAMEALGPAALFLSLSVSMTALAAFAGYRMLRRAAPKASASEDTAAPVVAASPGTLPLDPSYEDAGTE
ncbi:MAG: MFS transporter, partial [Rhodovibrionaceae bacterium]